MLKLGLLVGALVALLAFLVGCVPSQQPPQQPQGWFDQYGTIIFLVLIFGVFYLLMIRPQRKRQKQHQQMMQELKRGDKVITAGGIYGQIDSMDEESVLLKVESGATIRVSRSSVVGVRQR